MPPIAAEARCPFEHLRLELLSEVREVGALGARARDTASEQAHDGGAPVEDHVLEALDPPRVALGVDLDRARVEKRYPFWFVSNKLFRKRKKK